MKYDLRDLLEQAHMAGQKNAGVDPSYSNARVYCDRILENLKKKTSCDISINKENGTYT